MHPQATKKKIELKMEVDTEMPPYRGDKEVRDVVLADPGSFRRLADGLEVKEVRLGERRYVVCRNPAEAERDARMREGIVDRLRATLRHGPKAVVGNRGFARFLTMDKGAVAIDAAAIEVDARFDGVFVLRTNTDHPAAEVARLDKGLWSPASWRCAWRSTCSAASTPPATSPPGPT